MFLINFTIFGPNTVLCRLSTIGCHEKYSSENKLQFSRLSRRTVNCQIRDVKEELGNTKYK